LEIITKKKTMKNLKQNAPNPLNYQELLEQVLPKKKKE
jgi:hypothetical protein